MAHGSKRPAQPERGSRAVVMASAGQGGIIRLGTNEGVLACLHETFETFCYTTLPESAESSRAQAATTPLKTNIQGGGPG